MSSFASITPCTTLAEMLLALRSLSRRHLLFAVVWEWISGLFGNNDLGHIDIHIPPCVNILPAVLFNSRNIAKFQSRVKGVYVTQGDWCLDFTTTSFVESIVNSAMSTPGSPTSATSQPAIDPVPNPSISQDALAAAAERRTRQAIPQKSAAQLAVEHDKRQKFRRLIDPGITRPNPYDQALKSLKVLERSSFTCAS